MAGLFVAGNWKMNGTKAALSHLEAVKAGFAPSPQVRVMICPPATLIDAAAKVLAGTAIEVGAQDCHKGRDGAFTGDLSASILRDAGASAVILGHSERRNGHGETSAEVRAKGEAALAAGMDLIVCIGETAGERAAGLAETVCARQLRESLPQDATDANTVIAYEPVWAIGRGAAADIGSIEAMHRSLRGMLAKKKDGAWQIVYGGSANAANVPLILESEEVDGFLVGNASLNAISFLPIVHAAQDAAEKRGFR